MGDGTSQSSPPSQECGLDLFSVSVSVVWHTLDSQTILTNICIQEFLLMMKMKISNRRWRIHRSWNVDCWYYILLVVADDNNRDHNTGAQCVDLADCWSPLSLSLSLICPSPAYLVTSVATGMWARPQSATLCDQHKPNYQSDSSAGLLVWKLCEISRQDDHSPALSSVRPLREGKIKFHFSPFKWSTRPVRWKFCLILRIVHINTSLKSLSRNWITPSS